MAKHILVTDTLFIFEDHERLLSDSGFIVDRLAKSAATEEELCQWIVGKQGYILGGVEAVTEKVIEAADVLEGIAFTGSGYKEHIPAYESARRRGIAITITPGAVAASVADYALALVLLMTRRLLELGRTGQEKFITTETLDEHHFGIVGLGFSGQALAKHLRNLGCDSVSYFSRTRRQEIEQLLGISYRPLDELLRTSDVVSLHISKDAGSGYIGKRELASMQDGSILVNASFAEAVDPEALLAELQSGRLRSAFDAPPTSRQFSELPLGVWFSSNSQAGYNTWSNLKRVSDLATRSIINLLTTGNDQYRIA